VRVVGNVRTGDERVATEGKQYLESVVAVLELEAKGTEDSAEDVGVAADGRIDDDGFAFEVGHVFDGLGGGNDQIGTTIELAEHGEIFVGIEAQVDGVVDGASQDIVSAAQKLGVAVRRVWDLKVGDIEAGGGEVAQLVGD